MEACIGENITYTCNVSSIAHVWTAPGLIPTSSFVIPNSPDIVAPRYNIKFVSVDNGNIISSLRVLSDAEINNTNIRCTDVQHTIAVVLGECVYNNYLL